MYPNVYLGLYPDGRVGPGKTGSNTLGILKEGGSKTNRGDYINARFALTWKPLEDLNITGSYKPTRQ